MELHFLTRAQKITIIETMTIGKIVPSLMNVAISKKLSPTVRTQIGKRNMTNKAPTRKIISHVKIFPKM